MISYLYKKKLTLQIPKHLLIASLIDPVDELLGSHVAGIIVKYIYSQTDGADDQRSTIAVESSYWKGLKSM